ncbi:hypothetical protein E3N88_13528 [Mikania micrantha]|uniref:Reverse transcriptase Ty1/copia-type domain-containing protein n=1 Tax=Mikania micrantha TaxID=192012 RepID=A0A5N6P9Z5_9ASTR|nr:hypothetical protein E3N88_13528 [Mikania micrantha]
MQRLANTKSTTLGSHFRSKLTSQRLSTLPKNKLPFVTSAPVLPLPNSRRQYYHHQPPTRDAIPDQNPNHGSRGLASLDKENYLTEQPPVPLTREWRLEDSGIQMALWNTMEPQVLSIAQNFHTVKDMWDHLSSSFSAKESLSHAYSVVQAYSRVEQGDLTFTNYFTHFSKLQDELRALFPPTTDLKIQEERNTKMDVMMFIARLSPKYASARPLLLSNSGAISTSLTVPTIPILSVPVTDVTTSVPATTSLPTAPPPLLFTYARRNKGKTQVTPDSQPDHEPGMSSVSSLTVDPATPLSDTTPVDAPVYDPPGAPLPDIPIAFCKEPRPTTRYPIADYVAYTSLSPESYAYVTSIDSHPVPKNVMDALAHPGWRQAMEDELEALQENHTWDLVPLPPDKRLVGCRWVFTVKLNPDGSLHRLKARLVAKGYSQAYGIDYAETFSPVAKMPSVRICIALAAINHWPLNQLDVKNSFLNGILEEEVYMEQPHGFIVKEEASKVCKLRRSLYGLKQSPRAWFGRFSTVMKEFGMIRSAYDHSVFFRHRQGQRIVLVVYVDDIIVTGDDEVGITELKQFLQSKFKISDLGRLRYFLGIEVSRSSQGILLSQRKYVLDMLSECGLLGCKPVDSPMLPTRKLLPEDGSPLKDPEKYRRLVGKLNYLTVTRPDISFVVSVLSQFMAIPYTGHWDAALRVIRYLKTTPGLGILYSDQGHYRVGAFTEDGDGRISGFSDADWAGCPISRRSTTGYCVFVGGNLVSWKSKKQHTVSRSSVESQYRAMADVTSEMMWVRRLLKELGIVSNDLMRLYCDNQSAIHIAKNQVFHERTKHIEVDCHLIRDRIVGTQADPPSIQPIHVKTEFQLADIFTKPLRKTHIDIICNKLGMINIYTPT